MILTNKQTVLVTGHQGFIAPYFCRLALEKGYKIVGLDDGSYGSNPANVPAGVISLTGSISDYALVKDIFYSEPIHFVVNFSAKSHVDHAIKDSSSFTQTNIVGTQTLLECIRRFSPITRFVQVSTDEVNGELKNIGEMFNEESPHNPLNLYAVSKSAAELYARAYAATYSMNVMITASSNNIGAGQANDKLVPRLVEQALKGEPLTLYGAGEERRDWLWVGDHAQGVLDVMEKGQRGDKYCFGSGTTLSNLDVANKVIEMTGSSSVVSFIEPRVTHDFMYCVDASKAKASLGWKQTRSFEEALQDVITEVKGKLEGAAK